MAKTKKFTICFSPGQFACIEAAAAAADRPRGVWLRDQGLRAARYVPQRPAPLPALPPRRPPAKLTRTVKTMFTVKQFEVLDEHARACELTVAAFMREVLLGSIPVARRPIARSAIVAVNRAARELNPLVQLAYRGTLLAPDLMRVVTRLLDEIHMLRDALLTADDAASRQPELAK